MPRNSVAQQENASPVDVKIHILHLRLVDIQAELDGVDVYSSFVDPVVLVLGLDQISLAFEFGSTPRWVVEVGGGFCIDVYFNNAFFFRAGLVWPLTDLRDDAGAGWIVAAKAIAGLQYEFHEGSPDGHVGEIHWLRFYMGGELDCTFWFKDRFGLVFRTSLGLTPLLGERREGWATDNDDGGYWSYSQLQVINAEFILSMGLAF